MFKILVFLFVLLLCSCTSQKNVNCHLSENCSTLNIIDAPNKYLSSLAFYDYFRIIDKNKTPVYEVYLGGKINYVNFDINNDGNYDVMCNYNEGGQLEEPIEYFKEDESTLYSKLVLIKSTKPDRSPFVEPFVNTKQQTVVRNSKSYLKYLNQLKNLKPVRTINPEDIYESITDKEVKENIKVIDVEKDIVDIE